MQILKHVHTIGVKSRGQRLKHPLRPGLKDRQTKQLLRVPKLEGLQGSITANQCLIGIEVRMCNFYATKLYLYFTSIVVAITTSFLAGTPLSFSIEIYIIECPYY